MTDALMTWQRSPEESVSFCFVEVYCGIFEVYLLIVYCEGGYEEVGYMFNTLHWGDSELDKQAAREIFIVDFLDSVLLQIRLLTRISLHRLHS